MRRMQRHLALVLAIAGMLVLASGLALVCAWPGNAVIQTVTLGVFPSSIAIDTGTGHAFIANALDASVSMVDDQHGTVLRTVPVGSNGGADPEAVAADSALARVYVTTDDGYLTLFDSTTGAILHSASLGASGTALAVDPVSGHLFVASTDTGQVQMLDGRTVDPLHTQQIGAFPVALGIDTLAHRLFVASSGDNTLSVLDGLTGALLQTVPVGAGPDQVLVSVALHRIYVGNARDKSVTLLNEATGARVKTLVPSSTRAMIASPRMAVDEVSAHLFLAAGTHLDLYDARTGRLVARISSAGSVTTMAMNPITGHLLLALAGPLDPWGHVLGLGTVQVRDARTGALLHTVQVGVAPIAMAMDPLRKRVLVVNSGVNGDGTLAHIAAPDSTWPVALQWLRDRLPGMGPVQGPDPNGHGSVTVLDASAL
jgi:YVTN family beta-propeller protein